MDSDLRMVQKVFKCPLCLKGFKKLVHVNEQYSKCPECGHEHCSEMINSEFNRESVDSQYRLPFCNLPEEVRKQYHTVTDIHDKSPNNFYLDARRNIPNNNNTNNNLNNNQNNNNNFGNNSTNQSTNQNSNNAQNNPQNNPPPRNYNLFFIPFTIISLQISFLILLIQ